MAIDMQGVRNQLINYVRQNVGHLLSTVPGPNNTTYPAVIKSIKEEPQPQPPFVVVDVTQRKQQARTYHRQQLLDTGATEYENHYDFLCSYTVVGGDALKIAGDLESRFVVEETTFELKAAGIQILGWEDVVWDEDEWNSQLINTAILNFTITVPDVTTIDVGCMDTIAISGELLEDEEDSDPITLDFDVST